MLNDWSKSQSRKEIQGPDQKHCPDQQNEKCAAVNWEGSRACRSHFLLDQRTGKPKDRDNHQESADQHGNPQRYVIPWRVSVETCEGAAVIARGRAEGVKNFAEAVRTVVIQAGQAPLADDSPSRKSQDVDRQ